MILVLAIIIVALILRLAYQDWQTYTIHRWLYQLFSLLLSIQLFLVFGFWWVFIPIIIGIITEILIQLEKITEFSIFKNTALYDVLCIIQIILFYFLTTLTMSGTNIEIIGFIITAAITGIIMWMTYLLYKKRGKKLQRAIFYWVKEKWIKNKEKLLDKIEELETQVEKENYPYPNENEKKRLDKIRWGESDEIHPFFPLLAGVFLPFYILFIILHYI